MGLRARLALFFIAITVIPLAVAVIVLQLQLSERLDNVAQRELIASAAASRTAADAFRARAADLATDVAETNAARVLTSGDAAAAERVVTRRLRAPNDRAQILVMADSDGRILGSHFAAPRFADGRSGTVPSDEELAAALKGGEDITGALLEVREVMRPSRRRLGWVAAGIWADQGLLERLPYPGGGAVVVDGEVLAASDPAVAEGSADDLPAPGEIAQLRLAGTSVKATTVALGDEDGARLLLWHTAAPPLRLPGALLGLLVPAVLLAAAVGWVLASGVVAPVERAARVARSVAAGDLDQTLEPSGGRELGALAGALNTMSAELRERLAQLEASRDQLRQSLSRLGQTLSSSLDLDRTLAVVVETAIETLSANRGLLWLFTPERDALYVKVGRGVGQTVARLPVGSGLAGHVARVGVAFRIPADGDSVPFPSDDEPSAPHKLAVPMVGRGRVLGVLTILGDDPERPFSQDDLDTLRSFAAQASVAMENVMLHREAQRLSVTDPLTVLWNFRYFQLQADREMESAARFERPLSLLIIDLDHFKTVNDRFGHQVGDDVLVEVARRIQAATRVPDVVARYGGEEFVVLLPGTGLAGAVSTSERIRAAVSASKVTITTARDVAPLSVTCSIGVAEHPRHGTTVAGLLRSADAAMYLAKTQGRDRVVGAGIDDSSVGGPVGGGEAARR
ncbi:MAG: diguanylate cyclase [Nitriliruptorales bacterium]|nr:diguanylate cyclase [Nitriliruptorales bacterium]